jgi:PAP2 superfamily C-terminal
MKRTFSAIILRIIIISCMIYSWFKTQALIGYHAEVTCGLDGQIGDKVLLMITPLNQYVQAHPKLLDWLLISSSLAIDIGSCMLLLLSIFGTTIRPLLGMLLCFAMRQICQLLIILPAPEGMLWRDPSFPSIFVTYSVSNDFFFSGHTSLAILGAIELMRSINSKFYFRAWILSLFFVIFEILTILILKAHWTLDIFTGIFVAAFCSMIAKSYAGYIDKLLP